MRVLILSLLMAASVAVYAKKPSASSARAAYQTFTLFNGNLQLDIPPILKKEREYYHYWDKCPDGGYTIVFSAKCTRKAGMNMQLNIHDHVGDPHSGHGLYDPRKSCLRNAKILHDTTYTIGNKQYTVVATLAKRGKGSDTRTNNYHLTYYIVADGRTLEMRYNYWAEDDKGLSHWRDMSYDIANSIKWYSPGWVTAKN